MTDIRYPRKDDVRGLLVDMQDDTHEPRVVAVPPFDLMTDGGTGDHRRLRVDVAQTGFFSGTEYCTFCQVDLIAGAVAYIQAIIDIDTILFDTSIIVDSGAVQMELYTNGNQAANVIFTGRWEERL